MASLVLSFKGEMLQAFEVAKPRISIGRRPHHDIAIDNLAVSGDHAAIVREGRHLVVKDAGSTNGTKVNGQTVEKQPLKHGDVIEIGKYHLKYFEDETAPQVPEFEKTMPLRSPFAGKQLQGAAQHAVLKVLSGKQTGIEIPLTKPLTAIGKKGVQVVMITRRPNGFFLNHVQGAKLPIVNGTTLNEGPCPLNPEDVIELGGVRMRFLAK